MKNKSTLGILFPNSYDLTVPELTSERLMASVPFASRYRLMDFMLSSMVNSGIDNIAVLVKKNYHSLLDHIGGGREWDLTRKNGGLTIFPPFSEKNIDVHQGKVDALASIVGFLKRQKEKYAIISDTNIACNFDFKAFVASHIASGADVTVAYNKATISETAKRHDDTERGLYYSFKIGEENRVEKIEINTHDDGLVNLGMNIYCIDRELLIKLIMDASVRGKTFFERDILIPLIKDLKIVAYEYEKYAARITDMKSYFEENMKLLEDENLDALFGEHPIYTKIRDDNPTRYIGKSKVVNSMLADGCIIEGEVENCILFRGVKVGKGSKIKNCILMQDTIVGENVTLNYVISDKCATFSDGIEMVGPASYPIFVHKGHTV